MTARDLMYICRVYNTDGDLRDESILKTKEGMMAWADEVLNEDLDERYSIKIDRVEAFGR